MAFTFLAFVQGGKFGLQRMLLAAFCFGLSMNANATLTLQIRVTTHSEGDKSAPNTPLDKTEEEQVIVGEHYLSVKSGNSTSVLDFAKRRRYLIDLKAARYVDYSLFDTIGFRVMEMQNRQGLARAAAAAKIELASSDVVYNEQSLSVLATSDDQLDETIDGDDLVFAINGKPLLRRSSAGTPISASDAAGFVKFLRYTAGGHPLVLDKLAGAKDIPKQFTLSYREVGGSQTRHYQILGMTMSAPASYDLAPYTARSTATDEVDKLLDRIKTLEPPAHEVARNATKQQTALAFAEKRPLDAMLGALEFTLMTGEPMEPFTPEQMAQLRGDSLVQQVKAMMAASDKTALTAAIPVLQQIQQHKMNKGHMLTLFEANDRQQLGQLDVARPMFVSVLNINPWLAGAYKDLGDLQFRRFDMARAWRCWDAGRHMAPTLGLFSAINQFEQTLLQQHPEYF